MRKIRVNVGAGYDILIERGLLQNVRNMLKPQFRRPQRLLW